MKLQIIIPSTQDSHGGVFSLGSDPDAAPNISCSACGQQWSIDDAPIFADGKIRAKCTACGWSGKLRPAINGESMPRHRNVGHLVDRVYYGMQQCSPPKELFTHPDRDTWWL